MWSVVRATHRDPTDRQLLVKYKTGNRGGRLTRGYLLAETPAEVIREEISWRGRDGGGEGGVHNGQRLWPWLYELHLLFPSNPFYRSAGAQHDD